MSGMVEPISGVIGALIVEVSFVMFNYQFHSFLCFFLSAVLAATRQTLGRYQGDSLTHLILIPALCLL